VSGSAGDERARRPVDRLLDGERLSGDEARRLLESPEARCELAGRDPAALFDVLGALPPDPPAPPPPRLAGRRGMRSRRALRGLAASAAAAVLAAGALTVALRTPSPAPAPTEVRLAAARGTEGFRSGEAVTRVVRRLDSRTAQVVTVVPDSPEDPTVTLILDEEIDL
jgi:hypothetical protein